MHMDKQIKWDGEFPYHVLAPAGISVDSSSPEIRDCITFFQDPEGSRKAHDARSILRLVKNRLFYDFFYYRCRVGSPCAGFEKLDTD